jgi:uncharacterized protein YfcZ (UPF0381/DUF406 family)
MLVNIANHIGYVKNTDTGVVINNNEEEYKKFLAAREASKKNNSLCKRMSEVESELCEIKSLLLQLVHRNN